MADWTIVAIDDDPAALKVLQRRLSSNEQIRVLTAENAREGLALIDKERPNAIVIDHLPPDHAGISLCKTLKSNLSLKNIPILFFTAYREFGFEACAEAAGALRVIAKLDMPQLVAAIQRLKDPNSARPSDTED